MKTDNFQIDILDTGLFALDGGSMFGVVPKPLWSKAYNQGDDKNRIPLASKPLLIQTKDKKILVDTGNGIKHDEKFVKIYDVDIQKSNPDFWLNQVNLKREDITDVIFTHLHFDHSGGATIINNGTIEPAFPNAKYYVQKEHLDWARKPTEKDKASFIPDDFEPILAEGMLELIDGEGELFAGVRVVPVFGHTHAMQMIKIEDNGTNILYPADLCPTAAHLKIPFVMGYDNFPLTTIDEKKKYFPQAYEDNSIIIFEHDAFRQAVKLGMEGNKITIKEEIKIS